MILDIDTKSEINAAAGHAARATQLTGIDREAGGPHPPSVAATASMRTRIVGSVTTYPSSRRQRGAAR